MVLTNNEFPLVSCYKHNVYSLKDKYILDFTSVRTGFHLEVYDI